MAKIVVIDNSNLAIHFYELPDSNEESFVEDWICKNTKHHLSECSWMDLPKDYKLSEINVHKLNVDNKIETVGLLLPIEFSKQCLEDVIVTALEGGSNYWYKLGEMKDLPKGTGPLAIRIADFIWNGGSVPVYDVENSEDGEDESDWEHLGDLNLVNVKRGLASLLDSKDYAYTFWNVMSENYDANDADVIFQYMIMNEVTFA